MVVRDAWNRAWQQIFSFPFMLRSWKRVTLWNLSVKVFSGHEEEFDQSPRNAGLNEFQSQAVSHCCAVGSWPFAFVLWGIIIPSVVVAKSWDLMDCGPPGSSDHGIFPGKNIGVGCYFFFQGIFPTQGLNSGLLHCRQILYWLSYQGSP